MIRYIARTFFCSGAKIFVMHSFKFTLTCFKLFLLDFVCFVLRRCHLFYVCTRAVPYFFLSFLNNCVFALGQTFTYCYYWFLNQCKPAVALIFEEIVVILAVSWGKTSTLFMCFSNISCAISHCTRAVASISKRHAIRCLLQTADVVRRIRHIVSLIIYKVKKRR